MAVKLIAEAYACECQDIRIKGWREGNRMSMKGGRGGSRESVKDNHNIDNRWRIHCLPMWGSEGGDGGCTASGRYGHKGAVPPSEQT